MKSDRLMKKMWQTSHITMLLHYKSYSIKQPYVFYFLDTLNWSEVTY